MLDLITAIRFDGRVQSGRTKPCRLTCMNAAGAEVEIVAKLSVGCDRKESALAIEAIAAMLAADLDLVVPEPFLVRLEPEFIATIADATVVEMARRSAAIAFGSRHLPPGYTSWPVAKPIPRDALAAASEIFAFDAFIGNDDRRPGNPNCLFNGNRLAIYDHEMAFFFQGIIGWQPPWVPGALRTLSEAGRHLFYDQLRGKPLNLERFSGAWLAISDDRLAAYRAALPIEWQAAFPQVELALSHIKQVRDNIGPALQEVARVLQ